MSRNNASTNSLTDLDVSRLRATASRITRHHQASYDIVQSVLVVLLELTQRQPDRIRCLEAYAHRMVINSAMNWLLTSARETSMDDLDTLTIEHLIDDRTDPASRISNADEANHLVSKLPEKYRAPFLLRHVHGHSTEDVAAHLGISSRAARRLLDRATVELGRLIAHDGARVIPTDDLLYQTPDSLVVPCKELIRNVEPKLIVVGAAVAERLQRNPQAMYTLSPREFEQLILEILRDRGYEAHLTPATRDGGRDVLAYIDSDLYGRLLCLVEAKRYASHRKVGIDLVHRLYGTFSSAGASCAMLVTSSSFSAPARAFQVQHKYQLALKEYADLVKWIRDFGKKQRLS